MMRQWQLLAARFAAVSRRERGMLAAAVLLGLAFVLNLLWLEPASVQRSAANKALTQKQAELQTLRTQLAALAQQAELEQLQGEAALQALRRDYQEASAQLGQLGQNLVAAREMPTFLRSVVPASRALEVVSIRTLAATPLLPADDGGAPVVGTAAAAGGTPSADAAATPDIATGNLYKHSVEIRLAGNYLDLLAYVRALEQAPKKVLWGSLHLEVERHPRSVLTLTVHTLSLDPFWLSV